MSPSCFPTTPNASFRWHTRALIAGYPTLFADMFRYLADAGKHGPRPNFEGRLTARFDRIHDVVQEALRKRAEPSNEGRISCVFVPTGIQDNTINRLLLLSSSEHHLPMVPMAFDIQRKDGEYSTPMR